MRLSGITRKALLVTVVLAECLGCATRSSKRIYRLSKLDADYFLLSPDAPLLRTDRQTIRIPRSSQARPSDDTLTADCSVHGPWFTFSKASGSASYWIAQTPSLSEWQQTAGTVDMKDQWQSFERSSNRRQKLVSPKKRRKPLKRHLIFTPATLWLERGGPCALTVGLNRFFLSA